MNASSVRPWLCALLLILAPAPLRADDPPAAEVPKGELSNHKFGESKVFPGTVREYWVYVPKQYDPAKPACLYVNQDGVQYFAPAVFDHLIEHKEMPVTIGVFVAPGKVPALDSAAALDRFNRSIEYDTPDDTYSRFLIDELLPAVEQLQTADGRAIHLSHEGNDRAIAGASSGAICAFTVAWNRPDSFRRVFSTIGTYVGLRGGDCYPTLIRKTEPKPLRVFLEDGSGDLNNYGGDWWMANQTMERALVFSGYEVNHSWGEEGHNPKHATLIFADAMRWLWKDWPAAPKTGDGSPQLQELLVAGESWKPVAEGLKQAAGLAANDKGEVVFTDATDGKAFVIALDGKVNPSKPQTPGISGQAFGPDGRMFSVGNRIRGILATQGEVPAKGIENYPLGRGLVVRHDGSLYVTGASGGALGAELFHVSPQGEKKPVDRTPGLPYPSFPTGVTLSPDQSLVYVADGHSHWIYSFQIAADGSLLNGQRFHCLHVPEWADNADVGGLAVDASGRLYAVTNMGVQICDQAGRVNAILPLPSGRPTDICFGGDDFRTLFVACGDRVFSRKLKVAGAPAFAEPIKPSPPRL